MKDAFGKCFGQRLRIGGDDAALGDQPGDEPRGRHVERRIGAGASLGRQAHRARSRRRPSRPRMMRDFFARRAPRSGFRFTPSSIAKSIEGDGAATIERNVVVLGRERLQIGADLVADVAVAVVRSVPTMHEIDRRRAA